MDYRKNMNTPRDMIDDEMLLQLMRENEPVTATYGGSSRRQNSRRQNNSTERSGSCECKNQTSSYGTLRNSERREGRQSSCGCGNSDSNEERRSARYAEPENSCESCVKNPRLPKLPLAMAYVPDQEWEGLLEDEEALIRGTLFEALDLPWYQSACDGGNCRKCSDNR